jgi:hypothetical protein
MARKVRACSATARATRPLRWALSGIPRRRHPFAPGLPVEIAPRDLRAPRRSVGPHVRDHVRRVLHIASKQSGAGVNRALVRSCISAAVCASVAVG